MPDDKDTMDWEESTEGNSQDPLGILGWELAGKYKIRSYIGGGGFGEVYEGYNLNLPEQKLVFKFFKRVQSHSKFAKEAKILCMLDHPHISRVIDFLPAEGALVVAFIDGTDGGEILKKSGSLSEELFLKVARAMTSSIAYAHSKKIAHRDIKPSNIMFDRNNHVYLIDFGIAKEMGGDATKTAYQALTPLFAAPERQTGDASYNPFLSDIYETGVTLFNLATNTLPYRNPANPDPSEWGGSSSRRFSPQLRRILMKATHPDPTRRYQSAAGLNEEFEKLEVAFGAGPRRRSFIPYAAIAILLIAAGFLGRDKVTEVWKQVFPGGTVGKEPTTARETAPPVAGGIVSDSLGIVADSASLKEMATADSQALRKEAEEIPVRKTEPPPAKEKTEPEQKKEIAVVEKTEPRTEEKKPPVREVKPEEKETIPVSTEEEELASIEPIEEKPEPSPTLSKLILDVIPPGQATAIIDGMEGSPDSAFMVVPGKHDIQIVHPDYPVYSKTITVARQPRSVRINLEFENTVADSVNLQVGLSPPSDDHIVELALNKKRHTLTKFPVWDIRRLKGDWQTEVNIFSLNRERGTPKIDSVVAHPHEAGSRRVIKGSRGIMKLGSTGGQKVESVPVLIFWSEKN
jgi:predicted Ser/Thr protein kinase